MKSQMPGYKSPESKHTAVSAVKNSMKANIISIETTLSSIEEALIKTKEFTQKIYPSPSEEKENHQKKFDLLDAQIWEKRKALYAKFHEVDNHEELLGQKFDADENIKILQEARITLLKKGKVHIAQEINFDKLSSILKLKGEDEKYFKIIFEQFKFYTKMQKFRHLLINKTTLYVSKSVLLTWVTNDIKRRLMLIKVEFGAPLNTCIREIAEQRKELSSLTERFAKQAPALVSSPDRPRLILKVHANLFTLLDMMTNLTLLLKELLKKIGSFPTIEENFKLNPTNITQVKQALNQIQNDIQTVNTDMTNLIRATEQYQTSYPRDHLADSLPLILLKEALTQTSNLLDVQQETDILNSLIEAEKIEEKRKQILDQYKSAITLEAENRTMLSSKYIGEKHPSNLGGEIGDYLEKRNRKYAMRDFFFACLPGSERTKRTDYLRQLSVLIQAYAKDDFKELDKHYLELKSWLEQGIKMFKPRSNTSQESLKPRLIALLSTLNQHREKHKPVIEQLINDLPEPAQMRQRQ